MSDSDSRSALCADAPAVPYATWPRLSAVSCLVQKAVVPLGASRSASSYLPWRLRDIASDEKFAAALAPTQLTTTTDGLMTHVCAIAGVAGKAFLNCAAMSDFPILIRRNLPGKKAYLSPEGLMLPWPTFVNGAVRDRHDALVAAGTAQAIPAAEASNLNPDTGMNPDPFWYAVDRAVDPAFCERPSFATAVANGQAREWLVARTADFGGTVPSTLTVGVCTTLADIATRIEIRPDGLHLEIGFAAVSKAPSKAAAKDTPTGASEAKALLIAQWPCGSFVGFEPPADC